MKPFVIPTEPFCHSDGGPFVIPTEEESKASNAHWKDVDPSSRRGDKENVRGHKRASQVTKEFSVIPTEEESKASNSTRCGRPLLSSG